MTSTRVHPQGSGTAMAAYIDGTAIVRRLLDEPGSDVAAEVSEGAARRVASQLVYPEACAAVAAARRDGRLRDDELHVVAARLGRLIADLELVAVGGAVAQEAGRLADLHGLSGPAAIHLATLLGVAEPRIVVVTWDRELGAAAADCGMPVVPRVAVQAAA